MTVTASFHLLNTSLPWPPWTREDVSLTGVGLPSSGRREHRSPCRVSGDNPRMPLTRIPDTVESPLVIQAWEGLSEPAWSTWLLRT